MSADETPAPPALRVITADATPEEIAAIVAVLASLGGGGDDVPAPPKAPEWNAPHRLVRPAVQHGPSGWRSSGLPR